MPLASSKHFGLFAVLVLVITAFLSLVRPGGFAVVEAAETITLPAQMVASGEATLTVDLELPAGCKLNPEAPSTFSLKSKNAKIAAVDAKCGRNQPLANLPLSLTLPVKPGKTALEAHFKVNYCDDKLGVCFTREAVLNLPVEVSKKAAEKKLAIVYKVPAK